MSALTRENFLDLVLSVVHELFPLVKAEKDSAAFAVVLNGTAASMENLFRGAAHNPVATRKQIERWITELIRAGVGEPIDRSDFADLRDLIMPMILPTNQPMRSLMVNQPLLPGLEIAYAVDSKRSISYIPPAAFARWEITMEQLHETALDNLSARSNDLSCNAVEGDDGRVRLICVQVLDGYDAARLLLPSLHNRLREHLGSPFLAAIPNRDILICFRNAPDIVPSMKTQVAEDFRTMPHQVSDRIFLVTADGLAPYEPGTGEE